MSLIKLTHLPENVTVRLTDVFKASVFPEFIPVSDFNIGEVLIVVEIQSMKKDIRGMHLTLVTTTYSIYVGSKDFLNHKI